VQANEKNLYLRKHIHRENAERLNKVVSDKQRYQQILLNIIQNGVKFTYKGGIDIFLDYQDGVGVCPDCGLLVTTVNDTGVGMDKDMLKRLFRIFGTVS